MEDFFLVEDVVVVTSVVVVVKSAFEVKEDDVDELLEQCPSSNRSKI